jgi:hypothetical protein
VPVNPDDVTTLISFRLMRDESESVAYCRSMMAVRSLPGLSRSEVLDLLQGFDDATDNVYDMRGLMHTLEQRSTPEDYADALLEGLPQMERNAKDWAETMILRIVNSDAYRRILLEKLSTTRQDRRDSVRRHLNTIVASSERNGSRASETLAMMEDGAGR